MRFPGTARAALLDQELHRGFATALILISLGVFLVSCGGNPNNAQQGGSHTAYVTLPTKGSVMLLHINGATGIITPGGQTPQVTGTSPNGLALLPSKKFLYVANAQSNTISIFSIATDGTLTLTGTPTPEGGSGPRSAVIDPSGKYLLITNSLSNDVSVLSIDSSTGALQQVPGSPFPANNSPGEILMLPAGNYVYVSNSSIGMVTAFAFNSSTGALSQVQHSPFVSGSGASGLAIDGSSTHLYVANPSAVNPGSSTIGNISAFNIDSATGVLSPVLGQPFTSTVGTGPSALVVTPDGRFLFATTPGSSYSIWGFTIDSTTGQLTAVTNSPFSVAGGELFALIDTSGNFFYIGSQASTGITGYTYDPNTAKPTAITGSPFSTGSAPGKMVILN